MVSTELEIGNLNFETYQIRKAVPEDIPQIQKVTKNAFALYIKSANLETIPALTESEEAIARDLQTKVVLVAYIGNKIVGSMRLEFREDKTAYLSRFGVEPECQNLGIGKSLMHIADNLMREHHMKQLQLHTASQIASLIRFYYGRGFYIDSTTKDRGYIRALLCKDYE